MNSSRRRFLQAAAVAAGVSTCRAEEKTDPLPSWNDGPARKAVVDFVTRTTTKGGRDAVPIEERVAVFDNDGTLWCEQPMYVQLAFAFDRTKTLSAKNPEWKKTEPFKSIFAGDLKGVLASGEKGLVQLVMATHAGMTTDEFSEAVKTWLAAAKHPKYERPYTRCVYRPMLELLAYLRANGYRTYIVTGGGIEMVRAFAGQVYGIPPEQVIGSTIKTKYEVRGGKPVIVRLPELDFFDDRAGKPIAIDKFIGRRPTMAFGNSDGDFEMLEWTTTAPGPRFGMLIHHTDADREYAYDRKSIFGRLDRALDEAGKRQWVVTDMKKDWKRIFPTDS